MRSAVEIVKRIRGARWRPLRAALVTVGVIVAAQVLAGASPHGEHFGQWQPARSVDPYRTGLNTPYNDGCPIEAPDAHRLYFASDRGGNLDIYVAHVEDGRLTAGEQLPAPVNTAAREFCPTPLPGNQLLFVSNRANNCGGTGNNDDIYYTRLDPATGRWFEPQPLSCEVNSPFEEFSPSLVEAEGRVSLYFSSNRDTGIPNRHKIYAAELRRDGTWNPAEPVTELNSDLDHSDARPNVRKDGLEIVFDSTSGGAGPQIFTATRTSVREPWSSPVRLGPNVNVGSSQTRATLSRDGTRLFFGTSLANQPGDTGGDIFVSVRSRPGKGQSR